MTGRLLLGLLLITALSAAAAPDQPRPAEDPCALAKRIALSPPCLAGSACEALDLWHEAFGRPQLTPAGAGALPPELISRLPDTEVNLGKLESFETVFERLGEASGLEVVLHPDLRKEKISGELGPMPVKKAWRTLLGAGVLLVHFDGERVYIAQAPSGRPRSLGKSSPTFDCPAR